MLFVPRTGVRMLRRPLFIWTPATAWASSASLAVSAPHGALEPGARLIGDAGARGLGLGRRRRCSRFIEWTVMSVHSVVLSLWARILP